MVYAIDIIAARAEALFTSDLPAGCHPSRDEVDEAIECAVRRYGGIRGCVEELAACYGDHPDTAAPRMHWARTTVEALYRTGTARPAHLVRIARPHQAAA
jgi:hypothetical protein